MTGYFLACPNCGSTEQLSTIETITGLAGVEIELPGDGTDHHWSGTTTVIWDTSTSIGIQCACGWEHLGRDYVEQLVMPQPEPEPERAGSWIVYGATGGDTVFHPLNPSTGQAWTADQAFAQQEAAEHDDDHNNDHSVLALYVVGDLAFYCYGPLLYVCAMAASGPKVFDAVAVDVASDAIVRIFLR